MRKRLAAPILAFSLCLAACSQQSTQPDAASSTPQPGASTSQAAAAADQQFPDVVKAELKPAGSEFSIAVTISSPYDTPGRYADGWRVMTPNGDVLAEHELAHDHANEQPFTRERGPFSIPDGVTEVVIEGRDQANGYGGTTVTVEVPR